MKQTRTIQKETLSRELTGLIANVLDRDESSVSAHANLVDELEVDSVMRLEILVVLERTYGVKFSPDDLARILSIDDIRTLLLEKAGTKGAAQ